MVSKDSFDVMVAIGGLESFLGGVLCAVLLWPDRSSIEYWIPSDQPAPVVNMFGSTMGGMVGSVDPLLGAFVGAAPGVALVVWRYLRQAPA